jgi:hypothetical protein
VTTSTPYAERILAARLAPTAPLTRLADVLLWVDEVEDGHWQWCQAHRRTDGYAVVTIGGRTEPLHRYLYECLIGPVPDGMELDHTCHSTWCCSPFHVEPVTHPENLARIALRRPRCKRGHPYAEHGYTDPRGWRRCRECARSLRRKEAARGR